MSKVSRLEVIQTGARRRWTLEEKRRIVAESNSAPRVVSATARRYGLSTGQLFAWRRLVREGRLGADDGAVTFAQAVVAREPGTDGSLPQYPRDAENALNQAPAGRIEIVLAKGVRIIVDRQVDASALLRVISIVERR